MIMSGTTPMAATAAQAETPASVGEIEGQTQPQVASTLMPIVALILRLVTLVSLIVSLSVMASDSEEIDSRTKIHFNDIYSYRYVVATCVIGIVYTLSQLSHLIYEVVSAKKLSKQTFLRIFVFIGDKVILCLLGTGVGAAFGATIDVKSKIDDVEDALEDYVGVGFPSLRAKVDDLLNRAYIPTIFLLIAFLISGVSSVLSSLALTKKTPI